MSARVRPADVGRAPSVSVLERMLTSPDCFGLTGATSLQRAICRVSDGVPLGGLWEDPQVRDAFGGVEPPPVAPDVLCILAAIRGGKSLIAAAKALECALTCDVSGLSPGDELRIPVLSVDKDSAHQVFSHLVGVLLARPALRRLVVGEPTADSVTVRHRSGRPVEIKVVAMAKYGSTLVGRWLAGCVFDEAPRMAGAEDGVRNLEDALHAIAGRMRPGSQVLVIGSPNVPYGPVFDMVQTAFGRPSSALVVVKGTGPALNPLWWTPERCESTRRVNPRAYVTDVLGRFADGEDQLFSSVIVDAALRESPEVDPPRPGRRYAAAMDPAMRGNAWTLVVVGCSGLSRRGEPAYSVALARQWRGSRSDPLRPDQILREVAADLAPYGLADVWSDQHHVDSLRVIAEQHGLTLMESFSTSDSTVERVEQLRVLLEDRRLELPPDRVMRADLLRVRRRVNRKTVSIDMPTSSDGRHCDYVPSLSLCLAYPPPLPDSPGVERDPGMEAAIRAVDLRAADRLGSVFTRGLDV